MSRAARDAFIAGRERWAASDPLGFAHATALPPSASTYEREAYESALNKAAAGIIRHGQIPESTFSGVLDVLLVSAIAEGRTQRGPGSRFNARRRLDIAERALYEPDNVLSGTASSLQRVRGDFRGAVSIKNPDLTRSLATSCSERGPGSLLHGLRVALPGPEPDWRVVVVNARPAHLPGTDPDLHRVEIARWKQLDHGNDGRAEALAYRAPIQAVVIPATTAEILLAGPSMDDAGQFGHALQTLIHEAAHILRPLQFGRHALCNTVLNEATAERLAAGGYYPAEQALIRELDSMTGSRLIPAIDAALLSPGLEARGAVMQAVAGVIGLHSMLALSMLPLQRTVTPKRGPETYQPFLLGAQNHLDRKQGLLQLLD